MAKRKPRKPKKRNNSEKKQQKKAFEWSEAQKKQMELFIANGVKIVKGAKEAILKQIKSQDPLDGIATATVNIINRLETTAMDAGHKLDPDVELVAANNIMGEIINLYEQSSGQTLNEEQRYQAFSMALSMYLDQAVKTGKIEPNELQQMAEMMKQTPEGQEISQKMAGGGQPATARRQ